MSPLCGRVGCIPEQIGELQLVEEALHSEDRLDEVQFGLLLDIVRFRVLPMWVVGSDKALKQPNTRCGLERTHHEDEHEFAIRIAHLARVHDLIPPTDLEDVGKQFHVLVQLLVRQ